MKIRNVFIKQNARHNASYDNKFGAIVCVWIRACSVGCELRRRAEHFAGGLFRRINAYLVRKLCASPSVLYVVTSSL